jgi:hypothetical protein
MAVNFAQRAAQAVVVIPCGGAKLDTAAPAAELYTGSAFREALAAALHQVDGDRSRVLILSALHGLVDLDTVLAPYDVKMGDAEALDRRAGGLVELECQAVERGLVWNPEVYAMLPKRYLAALEAATRHWGLVVAPVYEACGGIGEQKAVLRCARTY